MSGLLLSKDHICQIGIPEDVIYLQSRLLPVNMRLFKSSEGYRNVVLAACEHVRRMALTKMSDYSQPYGMSGANVGIPFNIIGLVQNRDDLLRYCDILINPVIVSDDGKDVETTSNCGSIRLSQPIKIRRKKTVWVHFYDLTGEARFLKFTQGSGGFTVQHEVDHNLGILITDYER